MTTRGIQKDPVAGCDGKRALTHEQATKVAKRQRDRALEPYHCRFCRQWHMGNPRHRPTVRDRAMTRLPNDLDDGMMAGKGK